MTLPIETAAVVGKEEDIVKLDDDHNQHHDNNETVPAEEGRPASSRLEILLPEPGF